MSVGRQRLVQASASHSGALRDFGHALRVGQDTQGVVDQRRIAVLEDGFQIGGNVLGCLKTIRGVPG